MGNNRTRTRSAEDRCRLGELVDLSLVQKMVEAHYRAAGMPIGIIDALDSSILVSAGWQDICLKFHRANPVSRRRCEESDNYIRSHFSAGTFSYICANGLRDIGIPIMVAGRHLATMFLGQFFYEGEIPDRDFFKRQARECGYVEEDYLAALDRVPVFSREKVDYILAYNKALSGFIADLAEHALGKIKADRELQFTNAVLKAEQEESLDGILVVDKEQKIISCNKKYIEMWALPAAVVESRSNKEALRAFRRVLAHPDKFRALIKRVYEQSDRESFDEILLKDGRIFEQYSAPMTGPDGKYSGRVWYFRDITGHRHAEEALKESEQRFSTFFQLSPVPLLIATFKDGCLYEVNAAFEKLFGIPRDKAIGRSTVELGIFGNAKEREKLTNAMREKGTVRDFELDLRNSDGSPIAGLVSSTRILLDQKPHLLSVVIDITARKRAEKALAESEATMKSIFRSSPAGVGLISYPERKFMYVNERLCKMLGYAREEILGRNIRLIYSDAADYDYVGKTLYPGAQKVGIAILETRWRRRDGTIFDVLLGSAPLNPQDITQGISLSVQDITDRKRAEKALKDSYIRIEKSLEGVINAITTIVEIRDPYTAGHQKRVSQLAVAIAEEIGLPRDKIDAVRIASVLHDIGKIYVPAEILSKPGRLSPVEMEIVKVHPQASYEILRTLEFPWPVAEIARQHQERYNGTGYPEGLSGNAILLEARILAVADTAEAMMLQRPYRAAIGVDKALDIIIKNRGTAYDPAVVDAAVRILRDKRFTFEPIEKRTEEPVGK